MDKKRIIQVDEKVPPAQLVPLSSLPTYPYDEEHFYSCVRRLWQDGKRLEKYPE